MATAPQKYFCGAFFLCLKIPLCSFIKLHFFINNRANSSHFFISIYKNTSNNLQKCFKKPARKSTINFNNFIKTFKTFKFYKKSKVFKVFA